MWKRFRRLFSGGEVGDFAFVETHARRRAEQRFPVELTLHAYRCGHRVLSRWLRDAAIAVKPAKAEAAVDAIADFAVEYTNAISAIATSEYVTHTRALAAAEVDRRAELLNILLNGYDESDERVGRLLKRAGFLEQRQSYCAAVVQAVNAAEMEHRARAQRLLEAVVDAMAKTSIRLLAGVRNNLVVSVLRDTRRQSGWSAPCTGLAKRIGPQLQQLGPSVLVGISLDHPSTALLPKALQEAMTALDFADVDRRVVEFSTIPIPSRFATLFRGSFSLPVHRYVTNRRVERAMSLLRIGNFSNADIAAACGFASESHFNDVFKRVTGSTPGNFRRLGTRSDRI